MSILRVVVDEVEFFTDAQTGESGLSVSGLAKLCGVRHQRISDLINSLAVGTPIRRLQSLIGKDLHLAAPYKKKGGTVKIIRSEVCAIIIKHYAFEGSETAEYSLEKFTTLGIDTWIQGITGWQKPQLLLGVHPAISPRWHRRLVDFHRLNQVQQGWWCVFVETNNTVLANLEGMGYSMPDHLIPDISTGLGFRQHLLKKGYDIDAPGFRFKYKLRIPLLDHPGQLQTVEPWQYRNDVLGEFKTYIDFEWLPHQSKQYFAARDPQALPYVEKYLALPGKR